MSHLYSIAKGTLTGWRTRLRFGNAVNISSNEVPTSLWGGTGMYPWITTPTILQVVSDSGDDIGINPDTAPGRGARTVLINGLDENWVEQSEIITLLGTDIVLTTLEWWRINNFLVLTAGEDGTNLGTITLIGNSDDVLHDVILPGNSIARTLAYSVPAGHEFLVNTLSAGESSDEEEQATMVFEKRTRSNLGVIYKASTFAMEGGIATSPYNLFADPPVRHAEKTDIEWVCIGVAGPNNPVVNPFMYMAGAVADSSVIENPRW